MSRILSLHRNLQRELLVSESLLFTWQKPQGFGFRDLGSGLGIRRLGFAGPCFPSADRHTTKSFLNSDPANVSSQQLKHLGLVGSS